MPTLRCHVLQADFRDEDSYLAALFDVVLTLYRIPFDSQAVADLREDLRPDRERFR